MDERQAKLEQAVRDLISKWDDCRPPEGISWDDCCDDIGDEIEALRKAVQE